jgi:hypothetical protein
VFEVPASPAGLHGVETCAGGRQYATCAAGWLGLAAAPVFTALALWTAFSGAGPGTLCTGMQEASPLGGMAPMYALMSVFHAAPWMTLVSRRRIGASRA